MDVVLNDSSEPHALRKYDSWEYDQEHFTNKIMTRLAEKYWKNDTIDISRLWIFIIYKEYLWIIKLVPKLIILLMVL